MIGGYYSVVQEDWASTFDGHFMLHESHAPANFKSWHNFLKTKAGRQLLGAELALFANILYIQQV